MKIHILNICLFLIFASCQRKTQTTVAVSVQDEMDVVANKIDPSINPADDFFSWANGGWFSAFPMPPSESQWGIEAMVNEEIFQNTINICRNASISNPQLGSIDQKIGDLWATGMDTQAIEKQDITYVEPMLRSISNVRDLRQLVSVIGQMQTHNISPLFYGYVYQDRMASNRYAYYLSQGGISMDAREYYLNKSALHNKIREAYLVYVKKIFTNLGEPPFIAAMHASCVLKIETFLAEKHLSYEELDNPYTSYNKMSIKDLERVTPSVSWRILMNSMTFPLDSVVVENMDYVKHLDKGLKQFSIEDWKCYIKFFYVNSFAAYLPKRFRYPQFDFFGKTIDGRKQKKTQWKFLLEKEENLLGDALGRVFVKDFFIEKSQKRHSAIVDNLKNAFGESIREAAWLSPQTKQHALEKLSMMKKKIGYPHRWKDYASMKIDRKSFVGNIINANQWWYQWQMNKLQVPVDRNEWNITPQEYNAYYSPANNEVVVSAAVLTIPGFEDEQIDDAVMYGYAAASTIGHEMTHGFDLEGKEYDKYGNLNNWWTKQDYQNYLQKAKPLISIFNNQIVVDTFHCRGEATWNENIADLGGVSIALRAFKKTEQYQQGKSIAGFTPLQRFFMGYALAWMSIQTKERLLRNVLNDNHAPPKLRVNAILSNIPEFYEAFNVKQDHRMWLDPHKRVKIW